MTILTLGTFDLFHVGHVRLFRRCAEMGTLKVAVNSDEFVESYKGRRPVVPLDQRLEIVRACRYVDEAMANRTYERQRDVIERAAPDAIVVGDDWRDRDYLGQLGLPPGWLERRGVELVYVPRTTGVSSSDLKARASRN